MPKRTRHVCRYLVLSVCVIISSMCAGCTGHRESEVLETAVDDSADGAEDKKKEEKKESKETSIFVYVCGAVKAPGVYELEPGSRVYEAVEAAGGMTKEAADTYLNQAEELADGVRIQVPTKEEAKASAVSGQDSDSMQAGKTKDDGKVNLNTAGKEELMTLTGIGEAKAESILQYREEHGSFRSVEEITSITGIKDGVFQKIKDDITV